MSVKVAIRVRPFNQRQQFLGCICCVDMKQNTTILYENKQKNKKQHYFTFDYSLWSHDQYTIRPDGYMQPASPKYVDQQKIYNIIGLDILQNAWQGYNCCLFAYGQTGAGKSYSMIGYGANRGIIPMVCQQIFKKIKKYERAGEKEYQISLSMLEIYNQKVQDLFTPTSKRTQNGLKVRENKTLGVYVQGLTKHQVFSYADIEKRMDDGSKNKSLASTLMNEYSSRAHTIIMIEFIQKEWINKLKMNKKSSFINLVDLAGSERVSKTGISNNKDRLKEASNINKSLHTLGRVIETLAEQAAGKGKNVQVPYRDSSLTRILETALGGNSKTIMICAISPANDNYEQTLSTLRYADQTKKIKNKAIINESAVDKIIRELRQQNDRLKMMLQSAEENSLANSRGPVSETQKKQIRSNLRASIRQVQKEIRKNLKSFAINTVQVDQDEQESLMMTEFIDLQEPSQFFSELSFDWGNKAPVYITNLNQDELLNDKVRYSCEKDILITNKNNKKLLKADTEQYAKVVLCGLGIQQNHAKITRRGDKYFIQALSETSAEYTLRNGKPVYQKQQLLHNDRIILGINSVFVFKNNEKKTSQSQVQVDYEFVVNERQQQMENTSLITPTSLNLFLSNNLIKSNLSRQIYASPPLQSLNQTKKMIEQQNDADVFNKLTQIQKQFSKMVKQNQEKMKQKQEYYKSKLAQLKQQKEKQKQQKSTLQQKLMIKSIQSQSLKTKNSQLQKLKQKLSKYNDQKNKRLKTRESMLIQTDVNYEQDMTAGFIDLQGPNSDKRRPSVQFGVSTLRNSKNKNEIGVGDADALSKTKQFLAKSEINYKKNGYNYEDIIVQQFDDSMLINNTIRNHQNTGYNDSMLLPNESLIQEVTTQPIEKQNKIQEIKYIQTLQINNQLEKRKKPQYWQFRRIYNIKILCEMEIIYTCSDCRKKQSDSLNVTNSADQNFISKYLPISSFEDATLQQFHYKNGEKKKIITQQQMNLLELQILQLENQLAKQNVQEKSYDDMLLNYSIDRQLQNARQSLINRQSFPQRQLSDSYDKEIQLNLTVDQPVFKIKSQFKNVVSDFIQVLADLPELAIHRSLQQKIISKTEIKAELVKQNYIDFKYKPVEKQLAYIHFQQMDTVIWQGQIKTDFNLNQNIFVQLQKEEVGAKKTSQICEVGINTEIFEEESINQKGKITSFTAFLNEEFQQYNQNQTQASNPAEDRQNNCKQYVDFCVNTEQTRLIANHLNAQQKQTHIMVQAQMVTDINMETYSQHNYEQIAQQGQQNNNQVSNRNQNNQADSLKINEQKIITQQQNSMNEQEHVQQYILNQVQSQSTKKIGAQQNSQDELQQYLESKKQFVDNQMNTSEIKDVLKDDKFTNTNDAILKDASVNAVQNKLSKQIVDCAVNTEADQNIEANQQIEQQQIEQYLNRIQEEKQIEGFVQQRKQIQLNSKQLINQRDFSVKKIEQNQIKIEFPKIVQEKVRSLSLISQQIEIKYIQLTVTKSISQNQTPIKQIQQLQDSECLQSSKEIQNSNQKIMPFRQVFQFQQQYNYESQMETNKFVVQQRDKSEMIDEQIQTSFADQRQQQKSPQIQHNFRQNSNQIAVQISQPHPQDEGEHKSNNFQLFTKDFNLSFSAIEKHDVSYQQMSAMGFDGLLKQDELNSKIKLLEDKIKQLQQSKQSKEQKQIVTKTEPQEEPEQQFQQIGQLYSQKQQQILREHNTSKYVPIPKKKRKKKAQMTEQQKKQRQIERQLQAKIIQCNNQNLINDRNLQIHKRKRQADELRKVLFKKQKVELQKQLLYLIPMVRRFNLIAKDMTRLIEAKISIEYRNFSHYEMIEALKNYSINKNSNNSNIQIKIIIFNCEEGRIYSWSTEIFKNRYQIAEQTFQKYLQNQQNLEVSRNRGLQDRNEKNKDPFWDPVDYIPQGVSYLSMQVLLYNLTYQGYISIIYRSVTVAKLFVAITPVKIKKYNEDETIDESNQKSQMDYIQIYNQRNLLEKDIFFTISIESIKFLKQEERHKLDDSNNNINLNSLNSNILKYTISYELIEDDYKMNNYITPQIDFVENKQFKRIDYCHRHCFKNISQATLAYISDCPIKFNLNVMKDYNQECQNASFNQDYDFQTEQETSQIDNSLHISDDQKSQRSITKSINNLANNLVVPPNIPPKPEVKIPKSDFSKKASIIYENAQVISKLQDDMKKQLQKKAQRRKLEESRAKTTKRDKIDKGDKDKECVIY